MKNFFKKTIIFILRIESKCVLFFKKPKIIAITGTVGKTTTKDIIYAGLKNSFNVRKSPKGFNSDIGVLLTILNLKTHGTSIDGWIKNVVKGFFAVCEKNYPELLIVEVGANYPGEIQKNAKLLRADIVIFTRLPKIMAHMEFFDDRQHFVEEKLSLAKFMNKNGVIVYNGDDVTLVNELNKKIFKNYDKKTFGLDAEFSFDNISIEYDGEQIIGTNIVLQKTNLHIKGVLGNHLGHPITALLAIAQVLQVSRANVIQSLQEHFVPAPGRMRVFKSLNNAVIIDDSYNALPESIKNSAEILKQIKTHGRKIYVLGRLAELGDYTQKSYRKAIEYIRQSCDIIFLVNDGGKWEQYAKDLQFKEVYSFNKYGNDYFANTDDVGKFLKEYIRENDIVIFKGARLSTGFERAIVQLIKKNDTKYLVQDFLN